MYADGSPLYGPEHRHSKAVLPGDLAHPDYVAYWAAVRGTSATLDARAPSDVIRLSDAERDEGVTCGKRRFKTKRGKDKMGVDSEVSHVEGALGERAFVVWLNASGVRWAWDCSNHAYGGVADIGPCQVRAALRRAAHWGTKVKRDDPDGRPVVSFVHEPDGSFTFRGWLWAKDAKREDWLLDPGNRGKPNWFAPDDALHDPSTLLTHDRIRAGFRLAPRSET